MPSHSKLRELIRSKHPSVPQLAGSCLCGCHTVHISQQNPRLRRSSYCKTCKPPGYSRTGVDTSRKLCYSGKVANYHRERRAGSLPPYLDKILGRQSQALPYS